MASINIACVHCSKTYRVETRIVGKTVRCKGCGQTFQAAAISTQEQVFELEDDDLRPAAKSPTPTPSAASARAGSPPPLPPPPPPALSVVKAAAPTPAYDPYANLASAAQVESHSPYDDAPGDSYAAAAPFQAPGAASFAPGAIAECPNCKVNLPINQAICQNCGYDRRKAPVPVTPARAPRSLLVDRYSNQDEFDALKFRINKPYHNPATAIFETLGITIARWLTYAVVAFLPVLMWAVSLYFVFTAPPGMAARKGASIGAAFGFTILYIIFMGLVYVTTIPIVLFGVRLGAKLCRCNLPDEKERSRLLAVWMCHFLFNVLLSIFALALGSASVHAGGKGATPVPEVMLPVVFQLFLLASGVLLDYLLIKFFFRLRWLESLVVTVFFYIFSFLAAIILGVTFLAGSWIIVRLAS